VLPENPASEDLKNFAYWAITIYGSPFQEDSAILRFCNFTTLRTDWIRLDLATPTAQRLSALTCSSVWAFPISLAATLGISFPQGTEMFHFPWFAFRPNETEYPDFHQDGFPHSGIAGSKDVRSSPALIAAYHALHRLWMPRHPHMRP